MKSALKLLAVLLPLLVFSGAAFSQEMPPTSVPAAPSSPAAELHEAEAQQIALKRVPGKQVGESELDSVNQLWVFHILDAKGQECEVMVSQKTRSVSKLSVPRLALKQALEIALRKVPGKRSERRSDMATFDPKTAQHTFYIETKKRNQSIKIVTVSDRTGKVIAVSDMGDLG